MGVTMSGHVGATPGARRVRQVMAGLLSVGLLGGILVAPAHAAAPAIAWDSDGMAEIAAPPFTFTLELADYSSPKEIDREGDVRVDLSAALDIDACSATVRATPLKDGVPVGEPAYLDATDSYDYVSVWFPVDSPGTYALQIDASYETSPSFLCSAGTVTSTPYATTFDLFRIDRELPGPPSSRKVTITSSGSHTLVANTWSRSPSIRITFTIKDPEKRTDLLHSICMQDTYDCWFEDVALKPKPWTKKTSTGWTRTWDFWWERSSPAQCLGYYWNQPDVSVILVVSNRDGKVLGRKKHVVKLTCRR